MPLKVSDYYDMLIAEKNSFSSLNSLTPINYNTQSLLSDLQSNSKVARWSLIVWLMAFAIYITVLSCEIVAGQTESGTAPWYQRKAFEFQFGDNLIINNNKPSYFNINPSAQIIKYASTIALNHTLYLKVAKRMGNNPVPLTTPEKAAFEYYMELVKFAGTKITVVSQNADDVVISATIYYNPLVLDASGMHILNGNKPVEDAINNHLQSLQFDGVLHIDFLQDAIQKAEGVNHVIMHSVKLKPWYAAPVDYIELMSLPSQSSASEAGFIRVSAAAGETLTSTINYQSL